MFIKTKALFAWWRLVLVLSLVLIVLGPWYDTKAGYFLTGVGAVTVVYLWLLGRLISHLLATADKE